MIDKPRRIRADEWPDLRAFRLAALTDTPTAFGTTYEVTTAEPDDLWRQRAHDGAESRVTSIHLATAGGRWTGMVGATFPTMPDSEVHLWGMYVVPERRGRSGLADQLLNAAIDWALNEDPAARITLQVNGANEAATRFYRRYGFADTGEREQFAWDHTRILCTMEYRPAS